MFFHDNTSIAANIPAFPDVPAPIPALFCTGSRNIPQILCGSCQLPVEASIIFLFSPPPSPLYSMSIFYHTSSKWQPPVSGSKKNRQAFFNVRRFSFFMTIECSQSAHSIFMQFSLPCNVPQQLTYLPNCISLLPEVVSHISSMLIGSL